MFQLCQGTALVCKSHSELDEKYASMNSLIAWNISKVLESNPSIDLKTEIAAMQELLENRSWDINTVIAHHPKHRHLACALLAWQELGHGDASSLYQFIRTKLNSTDESNSFVTKGLCVITASDVSCSSNLFIKHKASAFSSDSETASNVSPDAKMPVETKIVMRCENASKKRQIPKECQKTEHSKVEINVDGGCNMESLCKQRLLKMDFTTTELKKRVDNLAKREGDRMRLLLRAEAAWRDLEQGYIKRLANADEKETELSKKIEYTISEVSNYKNECLNLASQLEEKMSSLERERDDLKKVEGEICERARTKLALSEELARADVTLAQDQCTAAQHSRDLRLKEEQARRKAVYLQKELETSRELRHDAERALRAELGSLKDHVSKVSKWLLSAESETNNLKTELDETRAKKSKIIEALDACKSMCDRKIHGKEQELKTKTETLAEIRDTILECRCKMPKDSSVEAKRTPSLAAICRCTSDENLNDSCSCKTLQRSLLSNLLKDLFEGLQTELGENGSMMPCELLKCLEDKHNWDRSSAVKSNLRNFFEKLLVGELNIAISSSIEKYHAQWVGESCADRAKRNQQNMEIEECQQRALETRAHELAKELAEQLFREKVAELGYKTKNSSALPCQCNDANPAATYSCILKTNMDKSQSHAKDKDNDKMSFKENVAKHTTQHQFQKVIKNCSLKHARERFKQVTSSTVQNRSLLRSKRVRKESPGNQVFTNRAVSTERNEVDTCVQISSLKKKSVVHQTFNDSLKEKNISQKLPKSSHGKKVKRIGQSYAVNLCLFEPQKERKTEKSLNEAAPNNTQNDIKPQNLRHLETDDSALYYLNNVPSVEISNHVSIENLRNGVNITCSKSCICLNKLPSNRSIDNILETFRKNKYKYSNQSNTNTNKILNSIYQETRKLPYQSDYLVKNSRNKESKNKEVLPEYFPHMLQSEMIPNEENKFNLVVNHPNQNYNEKKTEYKNYKQHDDSMQHILFNSDLLIGAQDVVTPTRDQCCKFTSMDRNFCTMMTSTQRSYAVQSRDGKNPIKECLPNPSIIPFDSNCQLEFLGVTLRNCMDERNRNTVFDYNSSNKDTSTDAHVSMREQSTKVNLSNDKLEDHKSRYYEKNVIGDAINGLNVNLLPLESQKCVCCNNDAINDNHDLEINTYNLLTEYLQKKFEDLKLSTSEFPNVPPREANTLFTQILEKVKKIILENSNTLTCTCYDRTGPNDVDASWRRACVLLQEYLHTKFKRIECSCSDIITNSNNILLPELFEKVCQLIENDFERLKNSCLGTLQCKKDMRKEEINQSDKSQSCDMKNDNRMFNVNLNLYKTDSFSNIPSTNLIVKLMSLTTLDKSKDTLLPNNEISYNLHKVISNNDFALKDSVEQSIIKYNCNETINTDEQYYDCRDKNTKVQNSPISNNMYAADCACNKITGDGTCVKPISNATNDLTPTKIYEIKKSLHSVQDILNKNVSQTKVLDYDVLNENEIACEKEVNAVINKDVIELKDSAKSFENTNNFTNTSNKTYDNIACLGYDEWDKCETADNSKNDNDVLRNKENLYNTLQLPIDNLCSNFNRMVPPNNEDMLLFSIRSQNCECEMVPICHVKMLIDNIERKLINSNCTCDSLNPNVCPAHNDTVSY